MNEPNLDDLSILIPTKFSLVTLAMKRARQLKAGSRPLIDTMSQKPVTIALQEILDEKVRLGPQPPSEELEKEEQLAMLQAISLSEPTSVSVTRRMEEIFGRDEEAGAEYDEDYEDFEDEEVEREEEDDEIETEKDALETDDEEDEEEGLVGGGPRRGADFLTDEAQETADEEIEEAALELEIDDEESEDDEEEEAEEVSVEIAPEEEAAAKKPAKAEPAAKAPKAKAEKAPAAKKTAKAKSEDEEEAPAKKPGRKPKA